MKSDKKAKALALKLYQQNKFTDEISRVCGVSRRTIQRWVREFEETGIVITGRNDDQELSPSVAGVSPTFAALEKVSKLEPNQTLDLNLSSRLAVRLLNLTETAIATVEECLTNTDIRTADRLKAAEMVSNWVGLNNKERTSIFYRVSRVCEASFETANLKQLSVTVKSEQLLAAEKEQQEIVRDYNCQIYEDFWANRSLPDELGENFDPSCFLGYLECEPDDSEDYEVYQLALKALAERGYAVEGTTN